MKKDKTKSIFLRYGWVLVVSLWVFVGGVYYDNNLLVDISHQPEIQNLFGKSYLLCNGGALCDDYYYHSLIAGKPSPGDHAFQLIDPGSIIHPTKIAVNKNAFKLVKLYLYVDLFDSEKNLIKHDLLLKSGYCRLGFSSDPDEIIDWFDESIIPYSETI